MNIEDTRNSLFEIVKKRDEKSFIYDFLKSFNFPKSTISKIKKDKLVNGCVVLKRKIAFISIKDEDLHLKIDELLNDTEISKLKVNFIIVTDFQTLLSTNLKNNQNLDIKFDDLPKKLDFFLNLLGKEKISDINESEADIKAAYQIILIYEEIRTLNPSYPRNHLNILFARLLFCFFAEDAGIFIENIFTDKLDLYTEETGNNLDIFLNNLFKHLNTENKSENIFSEFPYVNGKLFSQSIDLPKFNKKIRSMIIDSSKLDWSNINPDIFGSMIQVISGHDDRSQLGKHYTSVTNILKVIQPLFLDDINNSIDLADNEKDLIKVLNRLYKIKIFDPACGSGNFLIISYKFLTECEIRIFERLRDLSPNNWSIVSPGIKLSQFYGIEIEGFSSLVARVSLIIAKQQIINRHKDIFGNSKSILPLKDQGNIINDNSVKVDWSKFCTNSKNDEIYIIGNPPYKGARYQKQFHKDDLKYVFENIINYNKLDYISIWFYLASKFIKNNSSKFCFVTTNSLNQGQQVLLFWPHLKDLGMQIIFAHKSIVWSNNAKNKAGVIVSIIGVSSNRTNVKEKYLYIDNIKQTVKNINSYLYPGSDIFIESKSENVSGFKKLERGNATLCNGHFFLDEIEKNNLLNQSEFSKIFLKKAVGAYEYLNGINKYCLWIKENNLNEALKIEDIKIRLNKIKEYRNEKNNTTPYYKFLNPKICNEFGLITPQASSEKRDYLPIGVFDNESIVIDPNYALYDPELFIFGVLSSKMHMTWLRVVGGRLKNDHRYSSTLVYNTFPIKEIGTKTKLQIEEISNEIISCREKFPEKTLSYLYHRDSMPQSLKNFHIELDNVVDSLFSSKMFLNEEQRVNNLFDCYEKITNQGELFIID